ncbi:hypothetical protein Dsin_016131 [Dipteronia sinensis]|uniref:Disease resistance R13L4/SHOC-2-like LRR domain-containing protein n=1 Tax=Dipteronia sinensis TaxID=43782 RepID=A0AAE0ACI4_9ROSI|nr:hypothetical protein Dsin_016131 [Dipteronia sinensis]
MSTTRDIHLHPRAFVNMPNLRFLEFYNSYHCDKNKVHISEVLEPVFTELKYLHWYGYPLKSLHSNFHLENLVILRMLNSNVEELWRSVQQFYNLKTIDLRKSRHLIRCPDLSGAQNLKSLRLDVCTSLSEIPSSIQHINKVSALVLHRCKSLTSIPDCSSLKSLNWLDISYCSKLKRLPELPKNLTRLGLRECKSLVEIPSSFKHLNKVVHLEFRFCQSLTSIPDLRGLKSLNELSIIGCRNLKMLHEVPKNITWLSLTDTPIEELPPSLEDLNSLTFFILDGCSMLKSLPSSVGNWKSLKTLCLRNCSKIDKLPDDIGILKSLSYIVANGNGTTIREVQPSISCLKRLYHLDFSRSKGEDGEGLLLPPLLGLDNLHHLHLSDCGITPLPETLGVVQLSKPGSFIDVELPTHWLELDYNFLSFALCIVVANPYLDNQCGHDRDNDYRFSKANYECHIQSKDGRTVEFIKLCGYPDPMCEEHLFIPNLIRSNHVIIVSGYHIFCDLCDNQFSFQFYVKALKPQYGFTSRNLKDEFELYVEKLNIYRRVWSPFDVRPTS